MSSKKVGTVGTKEKTREMWEPLGWGSQRGGSQDGKLDRVEGGISQWGKSSCSLNLDLACKH